MDGGEVLVGFLRRDEVVLAGIAGDGTVGQGEEGEERRHCRVDCEQLDTGRAWRCLRGRTYASLAGGGLRSRRRLRAGYSARASVRGEHGRLNRHALGLTVAFIVEEEECLVLDDGPAEGRAKLVAAEAGLAATYGIEVAAGVEDTVAEEVIG